MNRGMPGLFIDLERAILQKEDQNVLSFDIIISFGIDFLLEPSNGVLITLTTGFGHMECWYIEKLHLFQRHAFRYTQAGRGLQKKAAMTVWVETGRRKRKDEVLDFGPDPSPVRFACMTPGATKMLQALFRISEGFGPYEFRDIAVGTPLQVNTLPTTPSPSGAPEPQATPEEDDCEWSATAAGSNDELIE